MAETGIPLTKQEVRAFRIGVAKYNTNTRNEILNKNIGKYAMFNDIMSPAIGEIYDIRSTEEVKPTSMGEGGILDFSIIGSLGDYLNDHYKRDIRNIDVYDVINPDPVTLYRWNGNYNNYLRWVTNVYGNEIWNNDRLFDILSANDIKYALIDSQVGVVRDINPLLSLEGAVLTNINNFSGQDTPLGLITNQLYAKTLAHAANFNTIRRTQYITPEVYEHIGNNGNTIYRLGDFFRVKQEDFDENGNPSFLDVGRLAYVPGENMQFLGTRPYTPTHGYGFPGYTGGDYPIGLDTLYGRNREAFNRNNFYKISYFYNGNITKYGFDKLTYSSTQPYVTVNEDGDVMDIGTDVVSVTSSRTDMPYDGNIYTIYKEGQRIGINGNDVKNTDYNGNVYAGGEYRNNPNSLLTKTARIFETGRIGTLIGRFHSSKEINSGLTQTAIDGNKWGISHGRNLLIKDTTNPANVATPSGYQNPYCRVWTYHHQYDEISKLIRPFTIETENGQLGGMDLNELQQNWNFYSRHNNGTKRLADHTVLGNNGFVRITPTKEEPDIKKTMFSIENLAWKDVIKNIDERNPLKRNLSKEQVGPLGGRIMWFPPYDIKFSENINTEWNQKQFIGRGERVYTYTDTDRGGVLSFTLLVDHPSVLNYWKEGKDNNPKILNANGQDRYENDILRFFAGCDILTLDGKDINNIEPEKKPNPTTTPPITPQETPPEEGSIVYYVFFPNNYSGVDDLPTDESVVTAMAYLFCGEGVQKDLNGNDIPLLYPFVDFRNGYEMNPVETEGISIENGYKIDNKWMYRVDDDLKIEVLRHNINYNDNNSFQLNSSLKNQFEDANYSFAEVFAALYDDSLVENHAVVNGARKDEIDKLKSILASDDIEFLKIKVDGMASSHGTTPRNNRLSVRRANSIKQWMMLFKEYRKHISEDITVNEKSDTIGSVFTNSTAAIDPKKARSARVEIVYRNKKSITSLSETNPYINNGLPAWDPVPPAFTVMDNNEVNDVSQYMDFEQIVQGSTIVENRQEERYDEEYRFFSQLEINSPTMRSRIMDKIQYFDPAFHSVTPEGFTNRLGFLHQCTRQGHTISAADLNGYAATAGNMAFGRPPVCVLRIGDFYNTKIIIENVHIDFDPMQWDLNPEGIGVQPMMAKINISFKFLGGSDLGGPIARLQNAVTSNFYANQSVFDNRADIVDYNNIGNPTYKQWNPENTVEPTYSKNDRLTEAAKTLQMDKDELTRLLNKNGEKIS